jgi:DNA polymerase III subunit epsilon
VRQIVLDTETTGLSPQQGHRIIEIGCIELVRRRQTGNNFHKYINPKRTIDEGAVAVHGITNEFLEDKPLFSEIASELFDYLDGAELIIHNAPFDMGFLNHEFHLLRHKAEQLASFCGVIDTLVMARKKHPGQANSLDALCKRYHVDSSGRDFHGALLDARLLADVYLAMTGGQASMFAKADAVDDVRESHKVGVETQTRTVGPLPVITANQEELEQHAAFMKKISNE